MKHMNEQLETIAATISEASQREGIQWTRVTWYSWWLAIILFFLVIPLLSFYIGIEYQKTIDAIEQSAAAYDAHLPRVMYQPSTLNRLIGQPIDKACTQEAKVCPDGSMVGRVGSHCEFAVCPNSIPKENLLRPVLE